MMKRLFVRGTALLMALVLPVSLMVNALATNDDSSEGSDVVVSETVEPSAPAEPSVPETPAAPVEPETPAEPSTPEAPDEPEEPAAPVEPETPEDTEDAETPEGSEDTEDAETPEDAENSEDAEGAEDAETPEDEEDAEKDEEEEEPEATGLSLAAGLKLLSGTVQAKITVDGDLSDWANIPGMSHSDSDIDEWKVARDDSGNVYMAFTGTASSEWYGDYNWKQLTVPWQGWGWQINNAESVGARIVRNNTANQNTPGPYYVEIMFPASLFPESYTFGFTQDALPSTSIPLIDGVEPPKPAPDPVYNGIVIDGEFADWYAVPKSDASDKDPNNTLAEAAMVFDGDWVYLYLREQPGKSATGAGGGSKGNFAIITDQGHQLLFQLTRSGVVGVEGGRSANWEDKWEIAIPRSVLPPYTNEINFYIYQGEMLVGNVPNMNPPDEVKGTFEGIVYDGHYSDWAYYPHTLIQYATPGIGYHDVDGQGALWNDGKGTLFGHVYTEHPDHLLESGSEFVYAVTLRFGSGSESGTWHDLYLRFVDVDGAGNINWSIPPEGNWNLPNGTYEFSIASTDMWGSSKNINDFQGPDRIFGQMKITISEGRNECEFRVDLAEVAAHFGISEQEMQTVKARFGKIGQDWIVCSGASSGPWIGIALSAAAVVGVYMYRKKSKNEVKPAKAVVQ